MHTAVSIQATWQPSPEPSELSLLMLRQSLQNELFEYRKCRSRLAAKLRNIVKRARFRAKERANRQLIIEQIEQQYLAQAHYNEIIRAANQDCLALCLNILERLCLSLKEESISFLANQIKSELTELSSRETLKVLCNPNTIQHLHELMQDSVYTHSYSLEADPKLARDSVLLELSSGTIQISLSGEMRALTKTLQYQLDQKLNDQN